MKAVRWLFVFLFYVAAELVSPAAAAPLETLDGEAEESIHLAGQARRPRLGAARRAPAAPRARPTAVRSSRPAPILRATARSGPVQKLPVPASESAAAPEDH